MTIKSSYVHQLCNHESSICSYQTLLVGGFSPTQLKNMRKSKWKTTASPIFGTVKIPSQKCHVSCFPPPKLTWLTIGLSFFPSLIRKMDPFFSNPPHGTKWPRLRMARLPQPHPTSKTWSPSVNSKTSNKRSIFLRKVKRWWDFRFQTILKTQKWGWRFLKTVDCQVFHNLYICVFLGGNVFFLINFGFLLRCGYIDGKKNWILVGMNALLNGGKWSLLTWLIFRKKKSFGFVFSWCWCRFKNYIEFAAGSIPTSTLADCRAQPARAWPLWPNQIRPKPFSALETVYLTAYFCLEKQPSLTSRSKIFSCESSRKSEPPFSLGWMTCFWLSHGLWMTLGHNTGG